MIKIGLIRLEDYESWIKSIGYDREWVVQAAQANMYRNLVLESAKMGAFSLPLTYDSYLTVLNAISVKSFKELISKLSRGAPVGLRAYIGLGATYSEAMENVRELESHELSEDRENTVVVHLDLNGYYKLIDEKGWCYVCELIDEMVNSAKRMSAKHGGLVYYAGGDNVICFVPHNRLEGFLKDLKVEGIKVGVGLALKPRDALKLATKALEAIRTGKSKKVLFLKEV